MTDHDEINYEGLAARLAGDAPIAADTVLRDEAATASGRELLLREYGSENAVARAIRVGRPRLGDAKRGGSPTVRGRIAEEEFRAFKELELETGKKQSELVRDAVHLLLQRHHKTAG